MCSERARRERGAVSGEQWVVAGGRGRGEYGGAGSGSVELN